MSIIKHVEIISMILFEFETWTNNIINRQSINHKDKLQNGPKRAILIGSIRWAAAANERKSKTKSILIKSQPPNPAQRSDQHKNKKDTHARARNRYALLRSFLPGGRQQLPKQRAPPVIVLVICGGASQMVQKPRIHSRCLTFFAWFSQAHFWLLGAVASSENPTLGVLGLF